MGDIKAEPTSVISPQAVPRAPGESGLTPKGESGLTPEPSDEPKTPVMYPVFYQIVQGYAGTASPAPHTYGPVSFMTEEDCRAAIASRPHPENFYCLRYDSAKAIQWTPPDPPRELP